MILVSAILLVLWFAGTWTISTKAIHYADDHCDFGPGADMCLVVSIWVVSFAFLIQMIIWVQ